MKKLFLIIASLAALSLASCSYDDSALWEKVEEIEAKVSDLETLVNAMNNNVYVKSVTTTDTGYVIEFTDGKKATITNGVDGADGDAYFKSVVVDNTAHTMTITLMDDTVIVLNIYVDDAPVLTLKDAEGATVTEIALGDLTKAQYETGLSYELAETNIVRSIILEDASCAYAEIVKKSDKYYLQIELRAYGVRNGAISIMSIGTNGSTIVTDFPVSFGSVTDTFTDARDNNVYSIALMNDGMWWMTQGLRYVPEGVTVSSDPTTGTVWYPATADKVADTSTETIGSVGYYYAIDALVDETITEENIFTFGYSQGLCPDGWMLPSVDNYANLILNEAYHKEGSAESANNYNAGQALKSKLIADGYTFGTTGMIQKNTATADAKYARNDNSCFWWTSTGKTWGDGVTTGQTSSYFYGAMAMGTDAAGTLAIAQNSRFAGYAVRCVRY